MAAEPVRFYSTRGQFGVFSNFARTPVKIDGREWPTTEHYFQAMKSPNREDQEMVRAARSPKHAAYLGRNWIRLRKGWGMFRVDVMNRALEAKAAQHEHFRRLLLSTGDAPLVEHTRNDSFWGDGGDGTGTNMLGMLLMCLRQKLREGKGLDKPAAFC